jgi:hypothetical protein
MCIKGKQIVNPILAAMAVVGVSFGMAQAEMVKSPQGNRPAPIAGVFPGENLGGITDRGFVGAPPDSFYVLDLQAGHFLDCGTGMVVRQTNGQGQDMVPLVCGVTMPETLSLPDIGEPAALIVHF